jgi:hypothetical protein
LSRAKHKPLAFVTRRDNHHPAATQNHHPDCRAQTIQIAALYLEAEQQDRQKLHKALEAME